MTIINGTFEEMDSKPETKIQKFMRIAKEKTNKTKDWVIKNPDMAIGLVGTAIAVGKAASSVAKKVMAPITMYDPCLKKYLYLKRSLGLEERQYIRERRAITGESLYEVLRSMDLLSRKNKF